MAKLEQPPRKRVKEQRKGGEGNEERGRMSVDKNQTGSRKRHLKSISREAADLSYVAVKVAMKSDEGHDRHRNKRIKVPAPKDDNDDSEDDPPKAHQVDPKPANITIIKTQARHKLAATRSPPAPSAVSAAEKQKRREISFLKKIPDQSKNFREEIKFDE